MSIRYLHNSRLSGIKKTTAPRSPYAGGYGAKIPSPYMLKLAGRWHRVYIMCFANSGSTYVIDKGHELFLNSDLEHVLQNYEEGVGAPTPLNNLTAGERFRFSHDGMVSTLTAVDDGGRYEWADYTGGHRGWAGSYPGEDELAWPLVHPTTDPQSDPFPEPKPEEPTWEKPCNRCGATITRWRGMSEVSCQCGAEYNAGGQQLRDDWRGNPSTRDDDIGDMEGYEIQHANDY